MRADRVGYGIGTSAPQAVGASNVTGVNVQPGTATLSVRVRNAAGTLTQGVNVTAGSQRADTGADGIARFPGLPAGSYAVSAAGVSEVASGLTANLAAGGTTFDVQTAAPVTLNGTVRDANGQPVPGAHVLATNATGATSMVLTGADGRYSFTRLKAGAYEVSYADGKRRATTRSLVIPATLDVTLATVATPLSVTTDGAARGLLEIKRASLYAPVLMGSADGLTGRLGLGGLEGSQEYRLTLVADGRPQVTTTFTTDPTGAPTGLPATIALGALNALPADVWAEAPAAKKSAKSATAAPDLPPMYQDFADTIFKAFDRAGGQLNGPKKIDFDTAAFRLAWVFFAEDSCDPDLEADLKAAENASNAIEKAFRDWQIVADQGEEDRAADMANLTAAAVQFAGQVTLVLSGIGALEAAAASVPAASLTAIERSLLDGAGNLAQSLSTAINDLRSGKGLVGGWSQWVDHVTGFLGGMMTLAAEDPGAAGVAGWKAGMGIGSSALGFLDTIKSAMWDMQNLRDAVDDNVAMTLADYLIAQQKYLDAIMKYKAALDRLNHYQAPEGEECPDPPPPVPTITIDLTDDNPGIEGLLPDDPNDIVGPAGAGTGHWLREGDPLEYTIHFENKATATLPARKVVITHVLDADADLSMFELGSAGFNQHLVTAPAKRQSWRTTIDDTEDSGTVVEVDARLNASTRTATWTFSALDEATGDEPADPLKGFLPAAINPPDGGGFATYRVKSLSGARTVDAKATHRLRRQRVDRHQRLLELVRRGAAVELRQRAAGDDDVTVVRRELERHGRRIGRGVLRRVRVGRRRRVRALADRHHRDVRDLPGRRRPPLRVLQRGHRRGGLRRGLVGRRTGPDDRGGAPGHRTAAPGSASGPAAHRCAVQADVDGRAQGHGQVRGADQERRHEGGPVQAQAGQALRLRDQGHGGQEERDQARSQGHVPDRFNRRGQDAHAQADDSREEEGLVQAVRHVGRGREGAVDGDGAIPAVM